jgi:hypothetical protein
MKNGSYQRKKDQQEANLQHLSSGTLHQHKESVLLQENVQDLLKNKEHVSTS